MPYVDTKPLIKSKAFILATIAVLLAIAGYLAEVIPGWAATIAVVVEFLQVLNRVVATSTIKGILSALIAAIVLAGAGVCEADEYDDLGCYVGSQTRAEFYAARDRAVLVNDNEAAETNLPKWEVWRATHPRPYKPGDKIVHLGIYGDRVLTVSRVEIDNEHGWKIRTEEGYGFAPDKVAPAPTANTLDKRKLTDAEFYDRVRRLHALGPRYDADSLFYEFNRSGDVAAYHNAALAAEHGDSTAIARYFADKPTAAKMFTAEEVAPWKAAYDREQARKAKKAAKKKGGKTAAVESHSPFMQVGLFGRFTRQQSSGCPGGNCNAAAAPAPAPQPAPQAVPEAPVAAARVAGPLSDRERKIIDRFDGSRRAVLKRLQSDAKLRERFAAEWNSKYQEKVNAADWQSILEVILRYLPQVIEILLSLLK